MPSTRASARLLATQPSNGGSFNTVTAPVAAPKTPTRKRKSEDTLENASAKKVTKKKTPATEQTTETTAIPVAEPEDEDEAILPAVLSFEFEAAKRHLIEADSRFEDLFNKMFCKPYEQLERVHPFRALATTIIGQQISWLAARSIMHKFLRLYDPSLPEKPTDEERKAITGFPTAKQVAGTSMEVLRTAGLSGRKAEYIQDLAKRFADGRLSTKKLLSATDEELAEMLIEVRGIGRWTVDMFAIFTMRRPDILPVGDLGVQKGLVRWVLALHSSTYSYSISPDKAFSSGRPETDRDELPSIAEVTEDLSSVPPASTSAQGGDLPTMPVPFTPSIKQTLNKTPKNVQPLPEGINVALLKSRLTGKNKVKGAILTPAEMTALTESWKPYRSLGVYYMWSLADGE